MATDEAKGEEEWPSERAAYELIEMVGMVRHPLRAHGREPHVAGAWPRIAGGTGPARA